MFNIISNMTGKLLVKTYLFCELEFNSVSSPLAVWELVQDEHVLKQLQPVCWSTCIACFVCVCMCVCVCAGSVNVSNMLHAHSRMCTCMQANTKVKVKKSGTLIRESTGEFNNTLERWELACPGHALTPRCVAGSTYLRTFKGKKTNKKTYSTLYYDCMEAGKSLVNGMVRKKRKRKLVGTESWVRWGERWLRRFQSG